MALFIACATLVVVTAFCGLWYALALRRNRHRAMQILRWIEGSLGPQGQATGITWMDRSRFKVPLRLRCGLFQRAWMIVDFRPGELPLRWLANRICGTRELVTFHADLDLPPAFSLHVHNFQWKAQSSRTAAKATAGIECGRFVISTRMDWQREISAAMVSLARNPMREFLEINFQRRSPHFSARLPLNALAPGSPVRSCMLETMREVAASASTSLS